MKPFSEASEQNKTPILNVLKQEFNTAKEVLEVGSGTGQHAVFFADQLPHLIWQTSDRPTQHLGILAWLQECSLDNVLPPIELDVEHDQWPLHNYDAVFSANTAHIMSASLVQHMFTGIGRVLVTGGKFCLYGPFNYHGEYTSDSNAQFDQWLKNRDPNSGIKGFEWLNTLASEQNMTLVNDYEMPVNNRILVWEKQSG